MLLLGQESEYIITDAVCVTIDLVLWLRKKNCRRWNKEL
jgi:hypothetical protein